jgi:hypothetical protein
MIFDLNPLDVLQARKLTVAPPHFQKMRITDAEYFEGTEDWVKSKLKGRYAVFRTTYFDQSDNVLKTSVHIAFEEPHEITYFILACPHLRRN